MKLRVLHGYFIFTETKVGQVSDFISLTKIPIVPKGEFYTLEALEDMPEYSITGKLLLGAVPAIETFEGKPWEVMEANEMVFDLTLGILRPILSIVNVVAISQAGNRFISNGLIQPGSITADGDRVKDYSAWFSRDTLRWTYSEVTYV